MVMIRYKNWRPTPADLPGLGCEDRQEWFVTPVSRNRDAGVLDRSNFDTALKLLEAADLEARKKIKEGLGLDPETTPDEIAADSCEDRNMQQEKDFLQTEPGYEIHRFSHWGPGWFEIILLHPLLEQCGNDMEESLEDYPCLDEADFCQREHDEYQESWQQWGYYDFRRALVQEFQLNSAGEMILNEATKEELQELYEQCRPSGEYYISESSGVAIFVHPAAKECSRERMAQFLRQIRRRLQNEPAA